MKKSEQKKSVEEASEGGKDSASYRTPVSKFVKSSSLTSEIEDEIQLERRKIYVEPWTREVLRSLIESGKEGEIVPSYHPAAGFTYSLKGVQKGNNPDQYSREFLENLVRLDILKKSFYDSISTCSKCESLAVTLHPCCPKCKSHNIDKASLTEHIPCGFIDQRKKYVKDVCPKCGKSLVEGEYRNMGRWYICNECGEKFDHPQFNLLCRECNNTFAIEEARVLEVPKFTLNLKREREIRQNVASLENISKLLGDLGFKVEMPGSITGHKSGIEYYFSMLAKKQVEDNELVIAVDHEVAEGEIQAQPVILYVYKISEMKVDVPIFIAMPKLSEAARKIAKGHDVLIIEGSPEGHDRIAQIKAEIENRISQINIQLKPDAAGKSETKSEEAPRLASPSVEAKNKGTPLKSVFKSLKLRGNAKNNAENSVASEETSEDAVRSNIVFLLDGSSSMKRVVGDLSSFELASEAIANVLMNPDPVAKDDVLSVIVFWDEFLKGFRKEILYENVSMGESIDPEKLMQFGKPKNTAGTPLWDAVEYAISFLQGKKGRKIVKLITDADNVPQMKDATISKLEKSSVDVDCIIIGSEGNVTLGELVSKYERGRFFESAKVESLVHALKA